MKSFFTLLTRLSLRFQLIVLGLVVAGSALGIIAITQLKQELLPSVSFPQTIILTQASGMSSEQVLNVLTARIEAALKTVPAIINTESTTTGAFGSVVIGRNNFGENQSKIQQQIQTALDSVWLPLRRIEPTANQNPQEFARVLLGDVTPEMLIFLQQKDPNFLFQLNPEVWSAFSESTLRTTLAYLASQHEQAVGDKGALQQLIDQEIIPQLDALDIVANITVSGGQVLPDKANIVTVIESASSNSAEASSLFLKLSAEVWQTISTKLDRVGELNAETASAFANEPFSIPQSVPPLPASWQRDHFADTSDLQEMRTLTQTLGTVFNNFATNGRIVGALGQTDDLTPEIVRNMLALDPTLVQYFKADQLAAMSPGVFAILPDEYISGLDGLTRDELAAKSLAQSLTGEDIPANPVNLPAAWRISPPQLISFSFDDLPLATFSVFSTSDPSSEVTSSASPDPASVTETSTTTFTVTETPTVTVQDLPEGPALPVAYGQIALIFGPLDTADDLFRAKINPLIAAQFGGNDAQLGPSGILNMVILLDNLDLAALGDQIPAAMKGLVENLLNSIDSKALIGDLSPEAIEFIIDHDPTFLSTLQASVYEEFADSVLKVPQVAPPLANVWNTLANRPQFADKPLTSASDLIRLGDGKASAVLNLINDTVPKRFAGYEVRLFDSLTPATIRYFTQQETNFFSSVDVDVLKKLSPVALQLLPSDVKAALDIETAQTLQAIADGTQESATQQLAALYATNTPPADPDAPPLNAEWGTIGNFMGVELDTADDLFRFFPDPVGFVNSFFDTAQGANFAPGLLGNLSSEALTYWVKRDVEFVNNLRIEALQLLDSEVLATQTKDIQERAASGKLPFKATSTVTRTNGNNSLLVTIFKKSGTNTVEAFHILEETMKDLDAEHDAIGTTVSFEQASFIEESIVGVAKEGGLGGIFAVVIILIFLSKGTWRSSPRRLVGIIMFGASIIGLALVVIPNMGSVGDVGAAFNTVDPVIRLLLILGMIVGLLIFLWPSNLPYPAWRSTLVVSISIPLSLLMALALMRWLPPTVNAAIAPAAENSSLLAFILRLFPASLTINIMTLSGLTVAIGRVVDDSIVVLENIFRQIQEGGDKKQAIIAGTRDVSVAIFSATVITVVVFLPLGLTGGLIGEFFLPFGLAVTYALLSSFIVAITVVPLLAYLFIGVDEASEEAHEGALERVYVPTLRWVLATNRNKLIVLLVAFASLVFGVVLFTHRPINFIPGLGEPQISVKISLPAGTNILESNAKTMEMENLIRSTDTKSEVGMIQTIVGGGAAGLESLLGVGGGVSENVANITIGINSQENLDSLTDRIRTQAEQVFGEDNVTVSAASLSDQGFGGLDIVLSGPEGDLEAVNQLVIDTLNSVPGIANATSDLAAVSAAGDNAPRTYIRIDGQSAIGFSAELETDNTIGVTTQAVKTIKELPNLPSTLKVSQGFQSELQTQGFQSLFVAMGIAILIVIVILMVTFGSVVHWFDIILSIMVAPVGAAVLLTVTDRVLGISAMIGMLMLIGIVVTNAVVLIDRVQANLRERKMDVQNALLEAGNRRLRPILMTALATVFALMPLALGFSKGAIIAAELGTVVIGGLVSSTLLTLIVVPVMYSLLAPIHKRVTSLFGQSH